MIAKVKYSSSYEAKRKRIQRLPEKIDGVVRGFIKRDLIEIRNLFKEGIKNDTLRLDRLAESTKAGKSAKGYPKPSAPLYGKGDMEGDRSYMNMLIIQKTSNGWKLTPSRRKHWSGKITLDHLFAIHEHGVKFVRGDTIIQIPPRPALLLAYRRWLIKRRQIDKAQEVRRALTDYINTGNKKLLDIFESYKNEK